MQIMPEVVILGFIYALPAYRDLMKAICPKHICELKDVHR